MIDLQSAAEAGNLARVQELIPAANKNDASRALSAAIALGHEEIVALLLETRPHLTSADRAGRYPTHEAARRGRVDWLEVMLAQSSRLSADRVWTDVAAPPSGDAPARSPEDGYGLMVEAIRRGDSALVEFLLERALPLDRLTFCGRSYLEMASALEEDEIAGLLQSAGCKPADPSSWNGFQRAYYGRLDLLRAWLASHPEDTRFYGSYLRSAAQNGHVEIVQAYAPQADSKARDDALGTAAANARFDCARALLAAGANPSGYGGPVGYTPVCWAASYGRIDMLELLAAHKGNLSKGTKGDKTSPLQLAIEGGHVETVRWLIDHGAKVDVRASDGSTALGDAQKHVRRGELVPLFESAGARKDFVKQLQKVLKKKLKKEERRAWRPTVSAGDSAPHASKYGGEPLLTDAAPRPRGGDGAPLPLLLQLDLRAHPDAEQQSDAVLQLFWDDSARRGVARRIAPAEHRPDDGPTLPVRAITGWSKSKADLPSLSGDPQRNQAVELSEDEEATLRELNLVGDKLGGWPDWVQEPSYPELDGVPLTRLVYQLEGLAHAAANLGDAGVGYLFADPDLERLAFVVQSC